jgi:uncharacterized protein YdcH (DUF465 family)
MLCSRRKSTGPTPDEDLLHRLNKDKLKLKDELAGHLTH